MHYLVHVLELFLEKIMIQVMILNNLQPFLPRHYVSHYIFSRRKRGGGIIFLLTVDQKLEVDSVVYSIICHKFTKIKKETPSPFQNRAIESWT